MILGAHRTSAERAWSVLRMLGRLTIFGTLAFAAAILITQGRIIGTLGWAPLLELTGGYALLGGTLMLSGVLGVAGLAFEDDDRHRWPRMLSLTSAGIGVLWFGIAAFAFGVAYVDGYQNAGVFLAPPSAILHAARVWLLSEWPEPER